MLLEAIRAEFPVVMPNCAFLEAPTPRRCTATTTWPGRAPAPPKHANRSSALRLSGASAWLEVPSHPGDKPAAVHHSPNMVGLDCTTTPVRPSVKRTEHPARRAVSHRPPVTALRPPTARCMLGRVRDPSASATTKGPNCRALGLSEQATSRGAWMNSTQAAACCQTRCRHSAEVAAKVARLLAASLAKFGRASPPTCLLQLPPPPDADAGNISHEFCPMSCIHHVTKPALSGCTSGRGLLNRGREACGASPSNSCLLSCICTSDVSASSDTEASSTVIKARKCVTQRRANIPITPGTARAGAMHSREVVLLTVAAHVLGTDCRSTSRRPKCNCNKCCTSRGSCQHEVWPDTAAGANSSPLARAASSCTSSPWAAAASTAAKGVPPCCAGCEHHSPTLMSAVAAVAMLPACSMCCSSNCVVPGTLPPPSLMASANEQRAVAHMAPTPATISTGDR
jgi:hypothetical protein